MCCWYTLLFPWGWILRISGSVGILRKWYRGVRCYRGKGTPTVSCMCMHSVTGFRGCLGFLTLGVTVFIFFCSAWFPTSQTLFTLNIFYTVSRKYFTFWALWPCHSASHRPPEASLHSLAWMLTPELSHTVPTLPICPSLPKVTAICCVKLLKGLGEEGFGCALLC